MYMQHMLLNQVPTHHQRAVYTALTTGPFPVHGRWVSKIKGKGKDDDDCDGNGCPGVRVAHAMVGQPVNYAEVCSHYDGIFEHDRMEQWLVSMMEGITQADLRRAWVSWDMGTHQERGQCMDAVRRKLASLPPEPVDVDVDDEMRVPIGAMVMAKAGHLANVGAAIAAVAAAAVGIS